MNIYQRVEKYFKEDRTRLERKIRKDLRHTMLRERYRGADIAEKIIGIMTIWTA